MEPVNSIGPRGRFVRSAGILLWMFAATAWRGGAETPAQPSEYQVKAAFLLNFTKFIEWPLSAFEDSRSPFAICILGDDPFERILDQLVEGESVGAHPLVVRRIRRQPAPKTCQVLFIRESQTDAAEILAGIGPGVLTVSDRGGFLHDGGIIAFVTQGRHVRFDISQRAASDAMLTISARLLSVARSVQK